MKHLIFRCSGHTYMIRYFGNAKGADEAIQSWVDNSEIDFTEADKQVLMQRLYMTAQIKNLFGP